ncbi:Prephenate dehydratase [Lipomyces japonicus]|uniref:Prephenate dehydratase n=1 Tax=Lipomyces japonicus TaxID=56871 RepID=UPI0034CF3F6F
MTSAKLIAYLGPAGTYSHQAVLQHVGSPEDTVGRYEYVPYPTIADCFTAIETGAVSFAVVPFSNSTNGPVKFTYDLIRQSNPRPLVLADTKVAVNHYVLASRECIQQINRAGEQAIKVIYSHPQVWGQCKTWLANHFTTAKKIDTDSTALATQIVADRDDAIAIASKAALQVADVQVFKDKIQDSKDNFTRFLVIKRYEGEDKNDLDHEISKEVDSI